MNFQEIKQIIINALGDQAIAGEVTAGLQPQLIIPVKEIVAVCRELQQNENAYFDLLSCMTGIDNGAKVNTMEVIYNLYSIPLEHHIVLKVILDKQVAGPSEALPHLPSVGEVYKTALWHEREIFDFFGIVFDGHPDLRRIFLPVDWKGYPLRKDYQQEEYYRGIRIEY